MDLNINCGRYQHRNQFNQAQIQNTVYQPYQFANFNEDQKQNWIKQEMVYPWKPNAGIYDETYRTFTKQNEDIEYLMLSYQTLKQFISVLPSNPHIFKQNI